MKVNVSVNIDPAVSVDDLSGIGAVPFAEIKIGDFLYSNSILGKVVKKTPKRAYVEVVHHLSYQERGSLRLPGAREFSGRENLQGQGLYIEDYGARRYVTLPDEMAFLEMIQEHKAWSTQIAKLRAEMIYLYQQRAIEQCRLIGAAKGIDMIFEQEQISS